MKSFNKRDIATKCRILGVHPTDDLERIKYARNRLAKQFHPDKLGALPADQRQHYESRFKEIQDCFEYIRKHHKDIQQYFAHLEKNAISFKGHRGNKSHWVYHSISKMIEDD